MKRQSDHSDMFRVLGVDTRLRIIEILKERGPMGVTDIAEELGVTPPAVSQHLKLLDHVGLVTKERHGYRVPYSIDEEGLDSCCGMLIDICTCHCGGHGRHTEADLPGLERHREMLEERLHEVEREIARLKSKKS
jgi:DNA-binding transcriptional ArsR family regulator